LKQTMYKFGVLALGMVLALPALAQQQERIFRDGNTWVREITGELAPARTLQVRVDLGAVHVTGADQPNITYTVRTRIMTSAEDKARRAFSAYRVSGSLRGDVASLTGDMGQRALHCSDEFMVRVPKQLAAAMIDTEAGEIEVKSIDGQVRAESGGGLIALDGIGGSVHAETGGGTIDVGTVGGDAHLETGGGGIRVRNVQGKLELSTDGGPVVVDNGGQWVRVETGGGSVIVRKSMGSVHCETGGGGIELGEVRGEAYMETGGGTLRLASAYGRVEASSGGGSLALGRVGSGVQAETGNGSITAEFVSGGSLTPSSLETGAGDIIVYLSPQLRASLEANIQLATGHTITSDFPELAVRTEGSDWGPRVVTATGNLNGGGPVIKLTTAAGNIQIRKANQ
jgi:DUF4097 and DUF4098 domain-containing protein YvlB